MQSTALQLSPHFTLAEFVASATAKARGIDNTMPAELIPAARRLCANVLEPVRQHFGAVRITSGYRCPKLTLAIGSKLDSQHCRGEAADIKIAGVSTASIAMYIRDVLPFDQLILEEVIPGQPTSGWVHVSYREGLLRRDVRTKIRGKPGYPKGLIL